jgi:hypothetical protein
MWHNDVSADVVAAGSTVLVVICLSGGLEGTWKLGSYLKIK